jgi:hypothetical protein
MKVVMQNYGDFVDVILLYLSIRDRVVSTTDSDVLEKQKKLCTVGAPNSFNF